MTTTVGLLGASNLSKKFDMGRSPKVDYMKVTPMARKKKHN